MTKGHTKIRGSEIVASKDWPSGSNAQLLLFLLLIYTDDQGYISSEDLSNLSILPDIELADTLSDLSRLGLALAMSGGFQLTHESTQYRDRQTKSQADGAERVRRYRARKQTGSPLQTTPSTSTSTNSTKEDRGVVGGEGGSTSNGTSNVSTRWAKCPSDVEQGVWDEFITLRRTKKATATDRVLKSLRKQGSRVGLGLQEVLEVCIVHGWSAFRASWHRDSPRKSGRNTYEAKFQGDPGEAGEIDF